MSGEKSTMERPSGLLSRLKITIPIAVVILGIGAGIPDAILVWRRSEYLFHGIPDVFFFIIFSVGVYALAGIGLAVATALVPPRLLGAREPERAALPGLVLAIMMGVCAAFLLLVRNIQFTTLTQDPWLNLVKIAVIAVVVYIAARLLANPLSRSRTVAEKLGGASALFARRLPLAGMIALFALSCWWVLPGKSFGPASSSAGRPNILFISFDTLGAGHVGAYGYNRPTTPHLDKVATEGVLFKKHFTASRITLPSHMTMFTSTYPGVHRVIDSFASVLDDRFLTMAGILSEYGYETGAMVDGGRKLNIGADHGFDHGFDFYDHYPERYVKHEKLFLPRTALNFIENFGHRHGVPDMHSDQVFGGALAWLSSRSSRRPFFLFLHTYDIHSDFGARLPYVSPRKYEKLIPDEYDGPVTGCDDNGNCGTQFLVKINKRVRRGAPPRELLSKEDANYIATLYDRGIRYTDDQFGRFWQNLRQMQLLDNTIVVLTSDHGEEFFEHNQVKHVQYYDEVLHVPLIIRYPAKLQPAIVDAVSRAVDLLPTVLDLADIDFTSEQFQGVSLASTETNGHGAERIAFAGQDHPTMDAETIVVRTATHKLIRNGSDRKEFGFNLDRPEELYDLTADPTEQRNIIVSDKKAKERLRATIVDWIKECSAIRAKVAPTELTKQLEMDEKSKEELKSLGYIK